MEWNADGEAVSLGLLTKMSMDDGWVDYVAEWTTCGASSALGVPTGG